MKRVRGTYRARPGEPCRRSDLMESLDAAEMEPVFAGRYGNPC